MTDVEEPKSAKESDDQTDCVLVRCTDCNRVVLAAVNLPRVMDAAMLKEIGELAASVQRYRVEHMPVVEVRKQKFRCKCKRTV